MQMLFASIALLPTLFSTPDDSAEARKAYAQRVRSAYEQLDSLYFEADVRGDEWCTSKDVGVRGKVKESFKVWMADGGRFRIEMFDGKKPVGTVVCDGREVTDWFPAENAYTRYAMTPFDKDFHMRCRLFDNRELRTYCDSWVDERGPFGPWLDFFLEGKETHREKSECINQVNCDVFVREVSVTRTLVMGRETWTLWFDAKSHMILKGKYVMATLGLMIGQRTLTTTYDNVQPNVALPEDIFTFKAPEGCRLIPADDSRFRTEEPIELTGKPAPALSLPSVKGATVNLADFKGKHAVLLVFWGTWCYPCQKEIPTLVKLHEKLGEKGLAVVGVCGGEPLKDVKKFLKGRPLPYLILHDKKQDATQAYGATSVPYTLLINQDGIVVRTWQGWEGAQEEKEIREELGKLLGESRKQG